MIFEITNEHSGTFIINGNGRNAKLQKNVIYNILLYIIFILDL